jgi:hypothetical protein
MLSILALFSSKRSFTTPEIIGITVKDEQDKGVFEFVAQNYRLTLKKWN